MTEPTSRFDEWLDDIKCRPKPGGQLLDECIAQKQLIVQILVLESPNNRIDICRILCNLRQFNLFALDSRFHNIIQLVGYTASLAMTVNNFVRWH